MKASYARNESTTATEDSRRIAALSAALRIICIANQVETERQRVTVSRSPQSDVEIEYTGAVPFGFAFTEGDEATFHVPSGHRFVIEQTCISCGATNNQTDVQLRTRSPHMFRQMTLACGPEATRMADEDELPSPAPVLVHGATTNTLLFSNGEVHSTSTVPP